MPLLMNQLRSSRGGRMRFFAVLTGLAVLTVVVPTVSSHNWVNSLSRVRRNGSGASSEEGGRSSTASRSSVPQVRNDRQNAAMASAVQALLQQQQRQQQQPRQVIVATGYNAGSNSVAVARNDNPATASRQDKTPQETNIVPQEVQNNDPTAGQSGASNADPPPVFLISPRNPSPSGAQTPTDNPVPNPAPSDNAASSGNLSGSRNPVPAGLPPPPRTQTPFRIPPPLGNANNTPGRQGSTARVDGTLVRNIINEAVNIVAKEDRFMELRLLLGMDKTVGQFDKPEPEIFADSPLNVYPLTRMSRIINWIGTLLNDFRVPISIPGALTHPAAVSRRIFCPFRAPRCDSENKYRTIDGTCNNVQKPLTGSAFTPMLRELAPTYRNDPLGKIDLPRTRGKFGPLPSARLVSSVVHSDRGSDERETRWSMQLTLWGQMLAHDLTDRAPGKGFAESAMNCCDQRIKTPMCFGIPVPEGDRFREANRPCLNFARSAEVTDIDCKLGRREQLNQASSYIDAGFIYGVTEPKLRSLRTQTGGLLATSMNDNLPIVSHPNRQASLQGFSFFAAGDDRVNEHTGLMGMETIWLREHNRVANLLGAINPSWDDETIFQETRRIVSAMVQHITYNEYLPEVIGNASMAHYGLRPQTDGYFKGYDPSVNGETSNVFATAAGRFGHSMIRSTFSLMDKSFNSTDSPELPLKDTFFTSVTFLQTEQAMMRGTMMDQSEPCDRMLSGDLRDNLHQTREGNGGDLAAFNIQRGRDHALPSYTAFRKYYGFPDITNFTNTTGGFEDHPMETVELFGQVYGSPEDVDVWSAGVAETPVDDAAVGPLFSNIIGNQFKRLKYGDRYYYESDAQPVKFTREQLQEIRKVTYASVLCNNMPFKTIQPQAFLLTKDGKNAKVPCSSIKGIDLLAWRES